MDYDVYMKQIFNFLMILFVPVNFIIVHIDDYIRNTIQWIQSIHFKYRIKNNVNPKHSKTVNVDMYINQFRYTVQICYFTFFNDFNINVIVNYKEKYSNPLIWYQTLLNYSYLYHNYHQPFFDYIKYLNTHYKKIIKIKFIPITTIFLLLVLLLHNVTETKLKHVIIKEFGL